MKRLTLALLLTFGLALPASGQTRCEHLLIIMVQSRLAMVGLTAELNDWVSFLRRGDEDTRQSWRNSLGSDTNYFANLDLAIRAATHVRQLASAEYESECLEDDK